MIKHKDFDLTSVIAVDNSRTDVKPEVPGNAGTCGNTTIEFLGDIYVESCENYCSSSCFYDTFFTGC